MAAKLQTAKLLKCTVFVMYLIGAQVLIDPIRSCRVISFHG